MHQGPKGAAIKRQSSLTSRGIASSRYSSVQPLIGRLTNWYYSPLSGSSVSGNYQYDSAGNLLRKGSRTFTYNSANQITNAGFTYDNNGNLTSDGTYNYVYDAEDRLTQVKRVSDSSVVATYTYNFNGLRKSKTVNGQTTNYSWDDAGNLVRESDINGNTLASYYYDAGGNLVGMRKNNQTYIYHNNLRGDIVSITDYNGNIQAQYHYDPWGTQISNSGTLTQPFRYAGYYYDDETGLYYLKNRYYSPALGRFLTKDSYEYVDHKDGQILNLYSYCGNDPVNHVDPDGQVIVILAVAGVGIVVLGAIACFEADDALHGPLTHGQEFWDNVSKDLSNRWDVLKSKLGIEEAKAGDGISEHKNNARPSTKGQHEKGQKRKQKDKPGGEKGDKKRTPRKDPKKRP